MANTDSRKVPGSSAPPQPQLPPTSTQGGSTTKPTTVSASASVRTKSVQKWRCDCCKIATFETLEEACAHEDECQRLVQEKLERKKEEAAAAAAASSSSSAEVEVTTHSFFQQGTKRKVVPANDTSSKVRAVIEIDSGKKSKKEARSSSYTRPTRKTQTNQTVIELLDSPPAQMIRKKEKRKKADVICTFMRDEDSDDGGKDAPAPAKRKTAAAASSKSNKKKTTATATTKKDWASIFSGKIASAIEDKALLAEQVAAEFQVKRRMEQERQRERQKKREQQATGKSTSVVLQAGFAAAPTSSSAAAMHSSTSTGTSTQRPPQSLLLAPRFPVPSHIVPVNDCVVGTGPSSPKASGSWLTEADLERARSALQITTTTMLVDSQSKNYGAMLPTADSSFAKEPAERDALQDALSAILIPPSIDTPKVVSLLEDDTYTSSTKFLTSLWADKYAIRTIPDDICGTSLRNVADQLTEFCQEWKVERRKAHERMASRQRVLAENQEHRLHKKKKHDSKKRQKYKDDDDDFMDSDEEQEWQLGSLCVLTGPVGSGKSSLVHAIAARCDCTVLEITTGDKRGSTAIRRAIEEATQSLSSLDMLKQRENSLFGMKELVDSDDEEDTAPAKGSAVTIVLIDEVDNLYETDGDNGFWTALSELTKRAKCPIFLTANSMPDALYSSSFRYTHVETSRPTPKECVSRMLQIVDKEDFTIRKGQEDAKEKHFEFIAELCKCDLRRIAHELQLFSRAPKETTDLVERKEGAALEGSNDHETADNRPRISEVRPRSIPSDTMSLLTINGTNFMTLAVPPGLGSSGYPVTVLVGDQECSQARIMDDSTILAVCPPCLLAENIEKSGEYRGTHRRSLAASYAPVSIYGNNKVGIGSTTRGAVFSTELLGDSKFASLDTPVVLEYHFQPSFSSHQGKPASNSGDESEEEFEYTDSCPQSSKSDTKLSISDNKAAPEIDWKLMARILKDGIDAWASQGNEVAETEIEMSADPHGGAVIDALSSQRQFASDAALFEECGLVGIPYMSGACRGFGFDLTDAFPKCTNSKSKP